MKHCLSIAIGSRTYQVIAALLAGVKGINFPLPVISRVKFSLVLYLISIFFDCNCQKISEDVNVI